MDNMIRSKNELTNKFKMMEDNVFEGIQHVPKAKVSATIDERIIALVDAIAAYTGAKNRSTILEIVLSEGIKHSPSIQEIALGSKEIMELKNKLD